jgi:hypothetical protein
MGRSHRVPRLAVLIVWCAGIVSVPVFAQQGQINGVITDSSGGVLPGVTVATVESGGISQFVQNRNSQYHSMQLSLNRR